MSGAKHTNFSFFLDLFFKEKQFPAFYHNINNTISNNAVYTAENSKNQVDFTKSLSIISDVPDYFALQTNTAYQYLKILKTPLYSGFLINLQHYKDLEDYLSNKLGRGRKSQLKRYRKRLDLCLSPRYETFFGCISKTEYDTIFEYLEKLTIKRFNQKEEINFELPYLKYYQDIMYPMILDKKACVFVIYDKDKPINITLNFIDKQTLFHWNSCYDIDYQVFNLGHINMVNHLDWAFKHDIKVFDMGRGDFYHKRKYINQSYTYEEHMIYDATHGSSQRLAYYKLFKLKLRFYGIKTLKTIKAQKLYSVYTRLKFKMNKGDLNDFKTEYYIINNLPLLEELELINHFEETHHFITKPINDFLHTQKISVHAITVYMDRKDNKNYYISGDKKHVKIIISKN